MLKAAVFDLDGTLCAVGKAILPETLALLEQLQRRGVQLALSSGKPIYYLCGLLRQTGLRDVILMGENGASVQRGVDLPPRFHYRMPVAPHTRAALTQLQEKLEAEFGPRIWFQPNQTEVTPFFSDETTHADLRTFLAQELNAEKAGITVYDQSDCIDLCPTGLDKGSGLAFLCTRMGWELSETAAVGDGVNDEPMLRAAGCSIGIGRQPVAGAQFTVSTIQDAITYLLTL